MRRTDPLTRPQPCSLPARPPGPCPHAAPAGVQPGAAAQPGEDWGGGGAAQPAGGDGGGAGEPGAQRCRGEGGCWFRGRVVEGCGIEVVGTMGSLGDASSADLVPRQTPSLLSLTFRCRCRTCRTPSSASCPACCPRCRAWWRSASCCPCWQVGACPRDAGAKQLCPRLLSWSKSCFAAAAASWGSCCMRLRPQLPHPPNGCRRAGVWRRAAGCPYHSASNWRHPGTGGLHQAGKQGASGRFLQSSGWVLGRCLSCKGAIPKY